MAWRRDILRERTAFTVKLDQSMDPRVIHEARSFRAYLKCRESGFSLVELLVVTAILLVLASAVMPLSRVTAQREREVELRRALRTMRTAIDNHKDAVDLGLIAGANVGAGSQGYPLNLEALVEGVEVLNDASGERLRFLRRIPFDPMTQSHDWGLRSYQDDPDSIRWSGDNVYDVYSRSDGTALDGTTYSEW